MSENVLGSNQILKCFRSMNELNLIIFLPYVCVENHTPSELYRNLWNSYCLRPTLLFYKWENWDPKRGQMTCLQFCIFISVVSATNSCVTLGRSLHEPGFSSLVCKWDVWMNPNILSILKIYAFVILWLIFSGIL